MKMESKEYFEKVMLYFTEQLRSSQRGLCFTSSGLIPNPPSLGKSRNMHEIRLKLIKKVSFSRISCIFWDFPRDGESDA